MPVIEIQMNPPSSTVEILFLPLIYNKYGNPTSIKTDTLQNMFGAVFVNFVWTWNVGGHKIVLEKFHKGIEEGFLVITHHDKIIKDFEKGHKRINKIIRSF